MIHNYTTFIFGHAKLFRMLLHTKYQLKGQNKHPIRKAHYVGTSVVLTLDPSHVKRLSIDEMTFFIQKPIENGIILEMRKLSTEQKDSDMENLVKVP